MSTSSPCLRDLLYMGIKLENKELDYSDSSHVTHAVFDMLRNAQALESKNRTQYGGLLGWPFHWRRRVQVH